MFGLGDQGVVLRALPNTCYLKIHNVWINMAKKRHKSHQEDLIKQKLLTNPFFSSLSFDQFNRCCKVATISILGPGDILLKQGDTPYNMYIVIEGELVYERKVKFIRDRELWAEVCNQLQREDDDTCDLMFQHLVKEPKPKDHTFQVIFKMKNVNENEIICAKQTLCE